MSKKNENQVVVTRSGYEKLLAELKELKTDRRQEVARKLEEARAFGDLSENAEYAAAKDEQSKIEGRIIELEATLGNVSVIDEEKLDTNRVSIGLTVTLDDLDAPGKSYTYMLVGSEELSSAGSAAPGVQHISQRSPVGQAILDHLVGDEVVVKIPKGIRHLKITAIDLGDRGKKKVKAAPKVESKTAADSKAESKAEAKTEAKSKSKSKSTAKTTTNTTLKTAKKTTSKAAPKPKKQGAEEKKK